jgi:hypothetical protein
MHLRLRLVQSAHLKTDTQTTSWPKQVLLFHPLAYPNDPCNRMTLDPVALSH